MAAPSSAPLYEFVYYEPDAVRGRPELHGVRDMEGEGSAMGGPSPGGIREGSMYLAAGAQRTPPSVLRKCHEISLRR